MKKAVLLGGLAILGLTAGLTVNYVTNPAYEVKHNKNLELICYINDDEFRVIDKSKILTYIEEENTWVFRNGYAKNCEVINTGKGE